MLKNTGVATPDLIKSAYPDEKRRKMGAYAVIECFQSIPCDPCQSSCSRQAICNMKDINELPKVDFDKCNGCGICVCNCPGLAIFIIDETYSDTHSLVKIPYEFNPLPNKGDIVLGLNREGKKVCSTEVEKVINPQMADRTSIVSLIVPKDCAEDVRFFAPLDVDLQANINCRCDKNADCGGSEEYVCRCEEITLDDIKRMIKQGYTTPNEMKIVSRAGMGACQGRTCRNLIMNIIARETGVKHEDIPVTTFRPPVKPIKLSILCGEEE